MYLVAIKARKKALDPLELKLHAAPPLCFPMFMFKHMYLWKQVEWQVQGSAEEPGCGVGWAGVRVN